jgi:hypothetical protein
LRVVLHRISPHETPTHRIIIPEVVVQQARYTIQSLAGEGVAGGHRAPTVLAGPIRQVQLHRLDAAVTTHRNRRAAQQVAHQIDERIAVLLGGETLPAQAVVGDAVRMTPTDARLGVAIEGDGVRHRRHAIDRLAAGLQDPVAGGVVHEGVAARLATGSRPACQLPTAVIAHGLPARCVARTGVTRAGSRVATGHVAHGIIGRVAIGDIAQSRHGVQMRCASDCRKAGSAPSWSLMVARIKSGCWMLS